MKSCGEVRSPEDHVGVSSGDGDEGRAGFERRRSMARAPLLIP